MERDSRKATEKAWLICPNWTEVRRFTKNKNNKDKFFEYMFIDNGIVVNENCRTNDPKIFAAGDCVSFPFNDSLIRLESVGNAIEQSEIAAENVLGNKLAYQPIPWFWSDQYNVKLQIVGLNNGYDRVFHRIDTVSYTHLTLPTILLV